VHLSAIKLKLLESLMEFSFMNERKFYFFSFNSHLVEYNSSLPLQAPRACNEQDEGKMKKKSSKFDYSSLEHSIQLEIQFI
jgi:hypothetical protein